MKLEIDDMTVRASGATETAGDSLGSKPSDSESMGLVPIIGRVVGFDAVQNALVRYWFKGEERLSPARRTTDSFRLLLNREVVLLIGDADSKPLITGVVELDEPAQQDEVRVQIDGDRLVLSAAKEIVFKCGNAQITLTRAGKILIQGAYVSSRSSGVNRIKGGSVQIN
jgi:hypothetical protein